MRTMTSARDESQDAVAAVEPTTEVVTQAPVVITEQEVVFSHSGSRAAAAREDAPWIHRCSARNIRGFDGKCRKAASPLPSASRQLPGARRNGARNAQVVNTGAGRALARIRLRIRTRRHAARLVRKRLSHCDFPSQWNIAGALDSLLLAADS